MNKPTNLTPEQYGALERILYTTQLAIEGLLPKDIGEPDSDVHMAVMCFTMIKMDVILLLTGEDMFSKALKETTDDVAANEAQS